MDTAREPQDAFRVTVDAEGGITLPPAIRDALGLAGGGELWLTPMQGGAEATTAESLRRRLRVLIRPWRPGEPLASEELIAERRAEALRDLG